MDVYRTIHPVVPSFLDWGLEDGHVPSFWFPSARWCPFACDSAIYDQAQKVVSKAFAALAFLSWRSRA